MLRVADAVIADGIDGPRVRIGPCATHSFVRPPRRAVGMGSATCRTRRRGPSSPPGVWRSSRGTACCRPRVRRARARPTPERGMTLDLVRAPEAGRRSWPSRTSNQSAIWSRRSSRRDRGGTASAVRDHRQKAGDDDEHVGHLDGVTRVGGNGDVAAALAAGTVGRGRRRPPWLFARPEFDGAFDVLFVDEASQMSLANAVAIGTCARSIVLHRRSEPAADGDARACTRAAPRRRRSSTWSAMRRRCPPTAACSSRRRGGSTRTSTHSSRRPSTADRLDTHPTNVAARRRRRRASPVPAPVLRWVPIAHTGNGPTLDARRRTSSPMLVSRAARDDVAVDSRRTLASDRRSTTSSSWRRTTPRSPRSRRRSSGRIGRRGTSGPSTSSRVERVSSPSTPWPVRAVRMPRGTWASCTRGTRLDVAVSRAESVAILVASPTLLEAGCRTPDQMCDG